jgi:hypothetical protein
MSNQEKAAQGSAATAEPKIAFSAMDKNQKLSHIGKVCLFFLTFGFAFPSILGD